MLIELLNIETFLNLDQSILAVICVLFIFSLILFFLSAKRFMRGKPVTASLQGLSGLSLGLSGLLSLSITANLYSYDRLTHEQAVATLTFQQIEEQQFQLEITYANTAEKKSYLLRGDEWQMDARIIKWHGWAQLLGLNAQYRLERISGRYSDIDEELTKQRSVYALSGQDEIDYWALIKDYEQWLPWVDAYYGSATYLPMKNNASYSVSLTQSGLIARPVN
ncbi:MAG: cation/multidrug efflux pump [Gammaproteobacteria bacterium]|jgi:hypothetical protein